MSYEHIKQSLHSFSQSQYRVLKPSYNKSNSFTELSDWTNQHRYLNESITLPRIVDSRYDIENLQEISTRRNIENFSQGNNYMASRADRDQRDRVINAKQEHKRLKSVDIKFGLPEGLKGFQKSFYEDYIKQKSERKGSKIKPSEYISMQQQNKVRLHQKSINQIKSENESTRNSIINRVMNRKNRLKRQHFLQQYLIANTMSLQKERQQKQASPQRSKQKQKLHLQKLQL